MVLGPSPHSLAPSFYQLFPAQEMPPGRRCSGRSYLSTSSTREARGTSGASWTLHRREGRSQSRDSTSTSGFPGRRGLALATAELEWDLPLEQPEPLPLLGSGVTYGRTGSTGSTIVTTSTLWQRRPR